LQTIITHINFAKGFRGGERQTQLLIDELSQLGYKQKLLVRENSQLAKHCKNIKNLQITTLRKPYIFHINAAKDSHILHAHETKGLQFAFFAHLFTHIPYIVTRRVDNSIKNNFFNALLYKKAATCVTLSNAIKETITKITKKATLITIPSAFTNTEINLENLKTIKQRFQNKFLIGHIGALDEKHKGQSLIINLAKKLQTSHPDIHFILLGKGEDEKYLKNLAQGLNNITFEGFVTNVNDYIAAFDLFVFPSKNEGLGSTLLDVMNHKVAIVASEVGGIIDIIQHNENGMLFDISQPQEFEELILELYENKQKREKIAKNGEKSVKKYSTKNMALAYDKIYKNIARD
jgi:glycosyltransferase involved in cell wall biosynthesis